MLPGVRLVPKSGRRESRLPRKDNASPLPADLHGQHRGRCGEQRRWSDLESAPAIARCLLRRRRWTSPAGRWNSPKGNEAADGEFLSGACENEMPRDSRILNLYDKSLYERRPLARPPAGLSRGDAILACTAITLATVVFFWAYDALVHRDPILVPSIFVPSLQRATHSQILAAPEVPIPNMQLPEIIRANADVPKKPGVAKPVKQAEAPPRTKKRVQALKRLPPEAAEAYASAPPMLRAEPLGGW
jgi:hypothetical protein